MNPQWQSFHRYGFSMTNQNLFIAGPAQLFNCSETLRPANVALCKKIAGFKVVGPVKEGEELLWDYGDNNLVSLEVQTVNIVLNS